MRNSSDWAQLRALLRKHSLRFGDFLLASGQRSSVYIDAKLTTCRAGAMPLVGKLILAKIAELGLQPRAVGGLTLGADPLAMAAAHESRGAVDAFIVRKEPKKHGTEKFIEGVPETQGLDVVVLDDVCTTGDSTVKAIERARAAGMNVLAAICLVDRQAGAAESIRTGFGIPFDYIYTLEEIKTAES
jgi:orotate phosphoribosyltransferase